MGDDKTEIIERVCKAIGCGKLEHAGSLMRDEYRHIPPKDVTEAAADFPRVKPVELFLRDGFVDCYTGRRLIFPGTLRIISLRLEKDFPYHKNWKMDSCHFAYYELFPVLDHVDPRARKGLKNDPSNLPRPQPCRTRPGRVSRLRSSDGNGRRWLNAGQTSGTASWSGSSSNTARTGI